MGLFCLKDYEEAARIRDSLRSFEEEEPVLRLRRLLKQAIAEERFEVLLYLILYFTRFSSPFYFGCMAGCNEWEEATGFGI